MENVAGADNIENIINTASEMKLWEVYYLKAVIDNAKLEKFNPFA